MSKVKEILADLYISIEEMNIAYLNGDTLRANLEIERQKKLRKLLNMERK